MTDCRPAPRVRVPLLLPVLPVLLVVAAGCGYLATPIEQIRANPDKYMNTEVTVSGEVTDVVKLPLLPAIYRLKDGTGEIFVVSENPIPAEGATVRVTGRIEAAAALGGRSLGLHLRETPRRR